MASSLQVSIELLARIEEYLRVLFRKIEVVWCGIILGGAVPDQCGKEGDESSLGIVLFFVCFFLLEFKSQISCR